MSSRAHSYLRQNVLGLIAIFIALGGTAYAANTVGSDDIIDESILSRDVQDGAVNSGDITQNTIAASDVRNDTSAGGGLTAPDLAADSVGGSEIATGGISSSDVLNSTLTDFDLGADSVAYSELDPGAFDPAEIAEVAPGFVFGIADNSIQTNEVSASSLTGADVATNSLTGSDIDETTLGALDGNDAHDVSCDPETDVSWLHCVELSFTAGRPMPVLMMATYQYHGVDDNPLGRCRTTLDGAAISSAKLYNSDHTSEIGGSQVDVVGVDAGSHTFGFDCIEDGPDDHDLRVNYIDLAEVQLGID